MEDVSALGRVLHQRSDSLPDHPRRAGDAFTWLWADRLNAELSAIG